LDSFPRRSIFFSLFVFTSLLFSRPWPTPTLGNHEAWYNWTAVTSRFTMPSGPTAGAVPPFWWSMGHGLAHFAQLCSEFPLDPDSAQVKAYYVSRVVPLSLSRVRALTVLKKKALRCPSSPLSASAYASKLYKCIFLK
jgi:hypothetical protein